MVAAEPTARDRKYHRTMLEYLIGAGAVLVLELEAHRQVDPKHIGIPFPSIAAQLEELRDDLRMWHGDMTGRGKEKILEDVFGITE